MAENLSRRPSCEREPRTLTRVPDPDETLFCAADAESTANEWATILRLCAEEREIGFGALDSFLSGPDLERRVRLVVDEAPGNAWLRIQLKDTLQLDQTQWGTRILGVLRRAADCGSTA